MKKFNEILKQLNSNVKEKKSMTGFFNYVNEYRENKEFNSTYDNYLHDFVAVIEHLYTKNQDFMEKGVAKIFWRGMPVTAVNTEYGPVFQTKNSNIKSNHSGKVQEIYIGIVYDNEQNKYTFCKADKTIDKYIAYDPKDFDITKVKYSTIKAKITPYGPLFDLEVHTLTNPVETKSSIADPVNCVDSIKKHFEELKGNFEKGLEKNKNKQVKVSTEIKNSVQTEDTKEA